MTTKTITPKSSSILAEAMDVLLQHLGPQKTAELWQVISAPDGDYLKIRKQLYLLYLLLKILSCIFNQWFTLIIQYGEVIARRRKADRPVSIASRGTRERWCRCSSQVRPQGWLPSLRGAGVVQPLGVSSGDLPDRYRTDATG